MSVNDEVYEALVLRMDRILRGIVCLKKRKDKLETALRLVERFLESNPDGLSKENVARLLSIIGNQHVT